MLVYVILKYVFHLKWPKKAMFCQSKKPPITGSTGAWGHQAWRRRSTRHRASWYCGESPTKWKKVLPLRCEEKLGSIIISFGDSMINDLSQWYNDRAKFFLTWVNSMINGRYVDILMWFVSQETAEHDLVLAGESRVSMGRPRPINSGQDQTFLWVAVGAIALCIPVLLVNFYLLRSLQCLAGFKLWCFIITIPPTNLLTLPNNLFFSDACPEKNDFSEWRLISDRSDRYSLVSVNWFLSRGPCGRTSKKRCIDFLASVISWLNL